MDGNNGLVTLQDIVTVSELPRLAGHLCDEHRVNYWLRNRDTNGAAEAGALWVRDGIAYASLSKLAAWLVSPSRRSSKRGPGRANRRTKR
jgi:hypothetical protein